MVLSICITAELWLATFAADRVLDRIALVRHMVCCTYNQKSRAAPLLRSMDLELTDGSNFKLEYLSPSALLTHRVESDSAFTTLMCTAVSNSPPTALKPWRILIGFDEYIPGNKLQYDNRRKVMVLSFTFLEFGQEALSESAAWSVPLVIRSGIMHKVVGGWARVLRDFLNVLLFGTAGIAEGGVPIHCAGQDLLLFGSVHAMIADGDGHKIAIDWRGQGSFTPCMKHHNVLRKDIAHDSPVVDVHSRACIVHAIRCELAR